MANVRAIHSVGTSIATFLRNTYPATLDGQAMPGCSFDLLSSGQLAGTIDEETRIGLLLYRVTMNEHARQTRPTPPMRGATPPGLLSLDLHYLLTAWSANAQGEQVPLAWAMRQLHLFPVLDASSLSPEAGWSREEVIQLVPAELGTEEMMRIWDALDPAYRLSVSYVARVLHIEPDVDRDVFPAVVATRQVYAAGVSA